MLRIRKISDSAENVNKKSECLISATSAFKQAMKHSSIAKKVVESAMKGQFMQLSGKNSF